MTEPPSFLESTAPSVLVQKIDFWFKIKGIVIASNLAPQRRLDFSRAGEKLKKHIYDYAITDLNVEREFVKELDTCEDMVVYAKLPSGFLIPTPVGDYNPDWAISFKDGSVKHVYFVAETKGTMSTMELRGF